MAFFRQYIAPLFIFVIFLVALVAVSSRIFLPSDMAAPAPISLTVPIQIALADLPIESPESSIPASESSNSVTTDETDLAFEESDRVADLPPSLATLIQGISDEHLLTGQL